MKLYDNTNWRELLRPPATADGGPELYPRQTRYGTGEARQSGLIPMHEYPDQIVAWDDVPRVIDECHRQQIFPLYHQDATGLLRQWNQGPYGYCWAYGLTAAVMGCRAAEGLPAVRLSPFSLGWLVGWRNTGYYMDRAIEGAMARGIAPVEYVPEHTLDTRRYRPGWEAEAKKYRPLEWWDVQSGADARLVIRQCLTILATGRPIYVGYMWWRHALECVGMRWERGAAVWQLLNSHNDGVIEIAGSRGIPDEAYGVRATSWGEG